MSDEEAEWLIVHPPYHSGGWAHIVGTTSGLRQLRDAIDAVLEGENMTLLELIAVHYTLTIGGASLLGICWCFWRLAKERLALGETPVPPRPGVEHPNADTDYPPELDVTYMDS